MHKQDCLPNAVLPVMLKRWTYEVNNCKYQVQLNEIKVCLFSLLHYFESEKYHQAFASESSVYLTIITAVLLIRFILF